MHSRQRESSTKAGIATTTTKKLCSSSGMFGSKMVEKESDRQVIEAI